MIIKRKKINYLKFLISTLIFSAQLFAMEQEQGQKRKRSPVSSLHEEVERVKKDKKSGHIERAIRFAKSGAVADYSGIYRLAKELDLPFLPHAMYAYAPENKFWGKQDLLLEATKEKDIGAARVLLVDGAKPDYVFKTPIVEYGYFSERDTVVGEQSEKKILHCADLEFFTLFLRNGMNPDTRWRGESDDQEPLLDFSLQKEYWVPNPTFWRPGEPLLRFPFANLLLYHGATIERKNWENKEVQQFMKHAHARRVYRMAKYLQRCFGTVKHAKAEHAMFLPLEIAYKIAEYRYGPLSDDDKKLIATFYLPDDYKKWNFTKDREHALILVGLKE